MGFEDGDIAELLAPSRRARQREERLGVQFGQGVVRSWDTATGENTVEYRGAMLVNLPILNTGEASALRRNSVVGILSQGGQYFIMGRITRPGDPDFASASLSFDAVSDSTNNFSLGTTEATKLSATIPVPAWADQALITLHMQMTIWPASSGELVPVVGRAQIVWDSGSASGPGMFADLTTVGKAVMVAAGKTSVITTPGSTITVNARAYGGGPVGANVSNTVALQASAVFRSVI